MGTRRMLKPPKRLFQPPVLPRESRVSQGKIKPVSKSLGRSGDYTPRHEPGRQAQQFKDWIMNDYTSVTDALDAPMLDNGSTMAGRSADSVSEMPGMPRAPRRPKAPRPARVTANRDGIRAFMSDFTESAVKGDTSNGQMNVAPATRDFLKAASFLVRK
jgi:hypothetical protein